MNRVVIDQFRDSRAARMERVALDGPGKLPASWPPDVPYARYEERPDLSWGDGTGNRLYVGDNLTALACMAGQYRERVKVACIDPPYNTGNAFVYADRYGSAAYLHMLHLRLVLARDLLREDGVLFLSCDDNEVHRIRLLLEEVFGEENYVGTLVRKTRAAPDNNPGTTFSQDHEYVLCVRKSEAAALSGGPKDASGYANPDEDLRGAWARHALDKPQTRHQCPQGFYPISDPATGNAFWPSETRVWRFVEKRMEEEIAAGKVIFPVSPNGRPGYKQYLADRRSLTKPVSSWMEARPERESGLTVLHAPYNTEGTREVTELLGARVFEFPKPVGLIKQLVRYASREPGDIVLDFFAGSGTTGHAVMDLSAEDGIRRHFLLVQRPEELRLKSKQGLPWTTIDQVTRERLLRAARRIAAQRTGFLAMDGVEEPDLGLSVFLEVPVWQEIRDDRNPGGPAAR